MMLKSMRFWILDFGFWKPRSWHPFDDHGTEQTGEGQGELLPGADGGLVLGVGGADVGQLADLHEMVLVAQRHLLHPPPALEVPGAGAPLAAAEIEDAEAVVPPPAQDGEVGVVVHSPRARAAVGAGVEGHDDVAEEEVEHPGDRPPPCSTKKRWVVPG